MSHIEPNRRQVLRGLAAGAPLAAILADPELARAAASALEDVSSSDQRRQEGACVSGVAGAHSSAGGIAYP